ncbi:MAG: hypothetical protein JNM27_13700 [Leptospirales bacterium]|nr:hypothetical protein [Leptospirales bacterium]
MSAIASWSIISNGDLEKLRAAIRADSKAFTGILDSPTILTEVFTEASGYIYNPVLSYLDAAGCPVLEAETNPDALNFSRALGTSFLLFDQSLAKRCTVAQIMVEPSREALKAEIESFSPGDADATVLQYALESIKFLALGLARVDSDHCLLLHIG